MLYHYATVEMTHPVFGALFPTKYNLPEQRKWADDLPSRMREFLNTLEALLDDGWRPTTPHPEKKGVVTLAHNQVATGEQAEERLEAAEITPMVKCFGDHDDMSHWPRIEAGTHCDDPEEDTSLCEARGLAD